MINSGKGIEGNLNVNLNQPMIGADPSAELGKMTSRTVSAVKNPANTQGIRSDGSEKHEVKPPSLRSRAIRKIHQFHKTWIKFSASQSGRFERLKDGELKQKLFDSISEHNKLVDNLDAMTTEVDRLKSEISQFEEDYGDVLAFRDKRGPGRSDLKFGKSFVYPGADGEKSQITFGSLDKSDRTNKVKDFHFSLRNDPKIKSCFDQYFQKKNDLAVCEEKMAAAKQNLYEVGEGMKPLLGKAIKQIYKDNADILQESHQHTVDEINKGLEQRVSHHNQSGMEKENNYSRAVESQQKVSGELREKIRALSGVEKKISSNNHVTDFVINQLKKHMPESQKDAYFNNDETVKQKMDSSRKALEEQREVLQAEVATLKAEEDSLLKEVKKNKADVWHHRAEARGINSFKRMAERRFGVHIPVGRQTGGVMGRLKKDGKEQLDLENKKFDAANKQEKNKLKQDLKSLKNIAGGKTLHGANANYSQEGSKASGERGMLIVQNLMQDFYVGENENRWEKDILDIINDQDLESLKVIEKNIKGFGGEDGAQKYQHILKFIHGNRSGSAL